MNDFHEDMVRLKDPKNIKEALFASGPSVLMRAFEKDPIVKRLIRGRAKVVPIIIAEIKENGLKLDTITLSCFAYILQNVDPAVAAKVLKDLFVQAMKRPDPFFVYFAAHTLRQDLKLPFKPRDPEYTYGQLQETLAWVERTQPD